MRSTRGPSQLVAVAAVGLLAAGCGGPGGIEVQDGAAITVSSDALSDGGDVPVEFTCDGDDVAPDLAWARVPEDTVEIAIIVDDPDAPGGTFTHWTVWGLGPDDSPVEGALPAGAVEGTNDFGRVGYGGPCPPEGDDAHGYRFRALALDAPLELPRGTEATELAEALGDRVIGEGQLRATYAR